MYLCGGLLFFYLLQWTIDWIWGYFVFAPNEFYVTAISAVAALLVSVMMYRNERTFTLANEVSAELKKVAWPNAKDTKSATIVVVIMTIISATVLGVYDMIWSRVTQFIYG